MKKRIKWIVLAIVAVLAGAWLWFSRPLSLEAMFPGFQVSEVTKINGGYVLRYRLVDPNEKGDAPLNTAGSGTAAPADPEAAALLEQLAAAKFSRSPLGTLIDRLQPTGTWRHSDGDISILADFPAPDWDRCLYLDLLGDELSLSYGGTRFRCSTKGHEDLLEALRVLIETHPYQAAGGSTGAN